MAWRINPFTKRLDYYLSEAELNAIYLRLDTTNDPLTGDLHAPAFNIPTKRIECSVFTSTGINACIDALGADGGEVYLPEGDYTIDSEITYDYDNTTIIGAGFGTIINASAAASSFDVVNVNGKNGCQLKDLRIVGSAGTGNTQDLIVDQSLATDYFVASNLKLEDSDGMGINFANAGSQYNLFYNVNVDNSDTHNIWLYTAGNYNKIVYCSATNSGAAGDGIAVTGISTVENCFAQLNTGRGIRAKLGSSIKGNTVLSNTVAGIAIDNADCVVSGNFISLNAGHGIQLVGDRQICTDNFISSGGNNKVGILVSGSDSCVIQGNHIRGAAGKQDWGIFLQSNADYNLVQGNFTAFHDTAGINILAGCDYNHIINNYQELESVATIANAGSNNTIISSTAQVTTSNAGQVVKTTRVTTTYTILTSDHNVFCDTDGGAFTTTLPAGVDGQYFRIVNTGSNNLTISPSGAELLIGVNSNFILFPDEALTIVYEPNSGWY